MNAETETERMGRMMDESDAHKAGQTKFWRDQVAFWREQVKLNPTPEMFSSQVHAIKKLDYWETKPCANN